MKKTACIFGILFYLVSTCSAQQKLQLENLGYLIISRSNIITGEVLSIKKEKVVLGDIDYLKTNKFKRKEMTLNFLDRHSSQPTPSEYFNNKTRYLIFALSGRCSLFRLSMMEMFTIEMVDDSISFPVSTFSESSMECGALVSHEDIVKISYSNVHIIAKDLLETFYLSRKKNNTIFYKPNKSMGCLSLQFEKYILRNFSNKIVQVEILPTVR